MNVQVVFQQMMVIVELVCLGIWMYKRKYISDEMTEKLSSIVVDVCNPMLCISCALTAGEAASRRNIAIGMLVAKAILPAEAMAYVVIVNILFSLLVYTHGIALMGAGSNNPKVSFGLLCSILTIVIFWFHIS